jgi:biofilm PGA synthesis N-glycosyltransferase PgaC
MEAIKFIIWISIILVFYSYFGYALLILSYLELRKILLKKKEKNAPADFEPHVSLIVAAFNEEDIIKSKIEDCLALNYPATKLKLVFVADGSTDKTVDIIKKYPQIELHYIKERQGKVAAINRVMAAISSDYVIFCDANTFLNKDAVKEIMKHYNDEKIGAVAGEKKVISFTTVNKPVKDGEGLYWKYESRLKKIDSDFYSVVGAAGELFSIRTKLFDPVPPDVLLDDFIISMNICKKGYRVIYEPKAFAIEAPSLTMKDEQNRKTRISAGGFQSIIMLKDLLNIFKYGKVSILYISHRVSRWILCPLLLPIIFLCNVIVLQHAGTPFYVILLLAQLVFYLMAFLGWLFLIKNIKINVFYIPYYFVFMNFSLYLGLIRFFKKKQSVLWDKAKRTQK